ncbi:MAG: MarR family transcriptional regulator [Clostridium sp.]|nr:MarR family transcriptional regulator [Clostridium sp.]
MSYSNLNNVSDNILKFIFTIQNVFTESDFFKKLPHENNCNHPSPNLPPSHIKVILYLSRFESPSISEIAKSLNISKSNMTPIIDKLIEEDLVTRYPDPKDRRVLRVGLTSKATNFFNYIRESAKNVISERISTLSENDLNKLESSLSDISDIFNKLDIH